MDAELIIIIVAVGLSILSGIGKIKKKNSEDGATASHRLPDQEDGDDPWETVRRYIEDAQYGEDTPKHQTAAAKTQTNRVSHTGAVYAEPDPYTAGLNKYADGKADGRNSGKASGDRTRNKLWVRTETPQTQATDNSDSSELLEEFDMRKAVIYSAILKPKFTEF